MEFFRPYEGEKPFFFVSYSHRNSEFVLDVISELRNQQYRLWYDEGIPAGGDWPKNIADHMDSCTAVLFFQSKTALASPNCRNEIQAACDQHKLILRVCLDDAAPPSDWIPLLKDAVDISGSNSASTLFTALTHHTEMAAFHGEESDYAVSAAKGRTAGALDLLIALLLIALLGLSTGIYIQWKNNHPTPPETIQKYVTNHEKAPEVDLGIWQEMLSKTMSFPDIQQENAVRNLLEIYDGDIEASEMEKITQLHFCGNTSVSEITEGLVYDSQTGWNLHGALLTEGKVMDLSLIGQMLNLHFLSLVYQPISALNQLDTLPYLQELNLAGCHSVKLETLPILESMQVLHLEHSSVSDLTVLNAQPALHIVTVSAEMFPLKMSAESSFDVVLVK